MLHDHLRLMNVFAAAGEISGRKKLQKMIYIAKSMGFPFQEKFEYHFYGPYSEELTLRVEELCNLGFIRGTQENMDGLNQYRYIVTDIGHEFLHSAKSDIRLLEGCFSQLNEQNASFLELVSTILYFSAEDRQVVTERISTLKSKKHYTIEEINEAYTYIDMLKKTAAPQ